MPRKFLSDNIIAHELFQISTKALIQNGNKFLLVRSPNSMWWDLPGGRIHQNEPHFSLEDTLRRELREELGQKFQIKIGEIAYAHKIPFHVLIRTFRNDKRKKFRGGIVAIGFHAAYTGGKIVPGQEVKEWQWISQTQYKHIPLPPWHKKVFEKIFEK